MQLSRPHPKKTSRRHFNNMNQMSKLRPLLRKIFVSGPGVNDLVKNRVRYLTKVKSGY